jgi:hypothetical protein
MWKAFAEHWQLASLYTQGRSTVIQELDHRHCSIDYGICPDSNSPMPIKVLYK